MADSDEPRGGSPGSDIVGAAFEGGEDASADEWEDLLRNLSDVNVAPDFGGGGGNADSAGGVGAAVESAALGVDGAPVVGAGTAALADVGAGEQDALLSSSFGSDILGEGALALLGPPGDMGDAAAFAAAQMQDGGEDLDLAQPPTAQLRQPRFNLKVHMHLKTNSRCRIWLHLRTYRRCRARCMARLILLSKVLQPQTNSRRRKCRREILPKACQG